MGKLEEINELEVEDPEDMVEFSAEDLTWTEIWGDRVAIIPYCRLQDFIKERKREKLPLLNLLFILDELEKLRRSKKFNLTHIWSMLCESL